MKREYIIPETDITKFKLSTLLYTTSVIEGEPDEGLPEAKRGVIEDEIDFFDDEDIEACMSFNVWED